MENNIGFLEIILGPMFSGKTTKLVDLYHEYLESGFSVAVINFTADTRYHDSMLSTHDKIMIPCIFANRISDVWENSSSGILHNADVILINEGQFFPDIVDMISIMVNKYNKKVHVCGLDGDFLRKPFGNFLELIPMSDKITKLSAICKICNQPAIFSHRITNETEQIVIGTDNYMPLCRSCYSDNTSQP
jgi:thymidine kinase